MLPLWIFARFVMWMCVALTLDLDFPSPCQACLLAVSTKDNTCACLSLCVRFALRKFYVCYDVVCVVPSNCIVDCLRLEKFISVSISMRNSISWNMHLKLELVERVVYWMYGRLIQFHCQNISMLQFRIRKLASARLAKRNICCTQLNCIGMSVVSYRCRVDCEHFSCTITAFTVLPLSISSRDQQQLICVIYAILAKTYNVTRVWALCVCMTMCAWRKYEKRMEAILADCY